MQNRHDQSAPGANFAAAIFAKASHIGARQIYLAPPDEGGGAAAGGAVADAAGTSQGAGEKAPPAGPSAGEGGGQSSGDKPNAGSAPALGYRPDGLPDHLLGANDKETIDKLFKVADGFRREAAERGAVPEKPDGYAFEASATLKPYVENFDKDPFYAKTREIAHKVGMTDKVFKQFIPALLEHMIAGNMVDAPVDAKAQLLALAPASAKNLDQVGQEAAAKQRVANNIAWVDGMKDSLPEGSADFLAAALASDPRAHPFIEFLRGQSREVQPAMGGNGGGVSQASLTARLNDPRNIPGTKEFDPAFQRETDQLYQKAYG